MQANSFTRRLGLIAIAMGVFGTQSAWADRLADIKARGSLICATLNSSEPLGYQDPVTRKTVGFDVDTCAAIAKRLGVSLDLRSVSVEARIAELSLGRVDLIAAALGYTKERAQQIAFSDAHYQVPIKLIVKSDSTLNKLADFKGKKISANKGSTPELYARRRTEAEVVTFQDPPAAFLALQQGKVDGLALAAPSAVRFVNETGGKFRFADEALAYEATALGVKKDEPALLAAVNKALAEMEASGEIDALWTKWYGPNTKFNLPREKKLTPISAFE
ncbi:ABC transporter substrate-binding protein [Bosea thiooxidans]|nr:ABC transporter substrate-binding protein [Bosea sp. (in: a-proteobacteria)]